MKRIALTGGFATGKSTVARMFEEKGIPWIDADALVHELMLPRTPVWKAIVQTFGETVLNADQTIARDRLGAIIFADPEKQTRLEAIIHPKVRRRAFEEIKKLEARGMEAVLIEIPLLFEAGWDKEVKWDAIIVVTCDAKNQRERARQKLGFNKEEIEARLKAQLPLAEKVKKADYVIDNSGSKEQTKQQVLKIHRLGLVA